MQTAIVEKHECLIINFPGSKVKDKIKADGTIDQRYKKREDNRPGAKAMSCLNSQEEINIVYNKYKEKIDKATTLNKEKIARRNLCMFICSINIGLRGGDFCSMKYEDVFDLNWKFKEDAIYMTEKTHKNVEIDFNHDIKASLSDYIGWLREHGFCLKLSDYIFTSQKGQGIGRKEWWKINSIMCEEAGITKRIGTHGLRKTMVHSYLQNANDYSEALAQVSARMGHADLRTTEIYACMEREKIKNNLNEMAFLFK